MKKDLQETRAPRRHTLVDKAPVIAAIIIAVIGWVASLIIASFVNRAITSAVPSYPPEGFAGYIIGAVVIMLLYKWWFRPEFQGQIIGGKPGKG